MQICVFILVFHFIRQGEFHHSSCCLQSFQEDHFYLKICSSASMHHVGSYLDWKRKKDSRGSLHALWTTLCMHSGRHCTFLGLLNEFVHLWLRIYQATDVLKLLSTFVYFAQYHEPRNGLIIRDSHKVKLSRNRLGNIGLLLSRGRRKSVYKKRAWFKDAFRDWKLLLTCSTAEFTLRFLTCYLFDPIRLFVQDGVKK